MAEDMQGRVLYVRRRKRDAPRCPRCGRRLLAGSTRGAVVYYYPACRCVIGNRKAFRPRVSAETRPAATGRKAA